MAIQGSLREAALPDVIQLLFLGRRTGCLAVADRQSHASVFFEDGWVTHAAIVNRRDRLGDMLVKSGRVTPQLLDQAIARQGQSHGQRLGSILVELGAITREELANAIHVQVEEAVFTLFTWTSGTFSFEPGVAPDPDVDRVRISPDSLLLEGARRIDEWSLIEKKISSFDLVFARDRNVEPGADLQFSSAQERLLPLVDGRRDVRALVNESGLTEYDACQALYGLLTAGLVHRTGTSAPATVGRSLDLQIDEHRNLGIAFFRTGMLEEAEREFRRVAELRPSEGQAPYYLGLIAGRQERWNDAAAIVPPRRRSGRASRIDPAQPRSGALQAGEPDQAEARLGDASGRAPERSRASCSAGASRRWSVAMPASRSCVLPVRARSSATDPTALVLGCRARAQRPGVSWSARSPSQAEGCTRFPGDPVLLNNQAVFLEASGDLVGAEAALNAALVEAPSLPQISKNLGDICYRWAGSTTRGTRTSARSACIPTWGTISISSWGISR
jgi:tetratricopeptide (TPR) repeat protein